jgi:hypothetical protein
MTQETVELDIDGTVVSAPRELVERLAAGAAARAGVSARHRDLSLLLVRALESGHARLDSGEVGALCAVLEEERQRHDRLGDAAAELLRALAA